MVRHGKSTHSLVFCFRALGRLKVGEGARPQKQLFPSGAIPTWLIFPGKERECRRAKSQKGIPPALEFSLHEEVYKYIAYRHNPQDLASLLYTGSNCLFKFERQSNTGIKTRYLSAFMEVLCL